MSRPLRIEFPGAVYHVTSRGDRRGLIYRDDEDRTTHLEVIDRAMDRFDGQVLAYCQMGNHFHLVLHTRQANLSHLIRHVNGVYTHSATKNSWPACRHWPHRNGTRRLRFQNYSANLHALCRIA